MQTSKSNFMRKEKLLKIYTYCELVISNTLMSPSV